MTQRDPRSFLSIIGISEDRVFELDENGFPIGLNVPVSPTTARWIAGISKPPREDRLEDVVFQEEPLDLSDYAVGVETEEDDRIAIRYTRWDGSYSNEGKC